MQLSTGAREGAAPPTTGARQFMAIPEPVFDYSRLALRQNRAARIALPGADFLIGRAAAEICDRLAVTNRQFIRGLDVFTPSALLAESVEAAVPGIAIERLAAGNRSDDLGLPQEHYDLVVSAFGLHWCNDLPGALAQIRRALKPDGLFMAALPGEGALGELRAAMIAAETGLTGGAAMRVDPVIEVRQAGALLQRVGFALPVCDLERLTLRYADASSLVADLRAMGATSALAGKLPPLPRAMPARLEAEYRAAFAQEDGRIPASFNIVYLTGWSPHESQQKPLKPGSARHKMSDFLTPQDRRDR